MKKRKISFQKTFNLISFIFLFTCCVYYGGRFTKLYLNNKEKIVIEENTLGKELKEKNESILKKINDEYYFSGEVDSNYVLYSNILFRVIKIGNNNVITMISDNSITSLAFGNDVSYDDSYINNWLNISDNDYSGILEKNLNSKSAYLTNVPLCTDSIDEVNNSECDNYSSDYYISLLSVSDYINTGASNGFVNSNEYFYLANQNSDKEIWYVNNNGKIDISDGNDIYGVKPVIKLKENINLVSGDGSKDNPYIIESSFGVFGSYVKLDDDIWRVIDVNDDGIKLMYDDYIKDGNDVVSYKYSNYSYYHDDTVSGSVAYYLKNTFLSNLSYKDIVKEVDYANGYYGSDNDYDYTDVLDTTINTKVALVSVGDIILNHELKDYFTSTSSSKKGNFVYTVQSNNILYSKIISSTLHVVPIITIDKDKVSGEGTKNSPMELVD